MRAREAPIPQDAMNKEQDFYRLEKNILELKKEIDELDTSEEPTREAKISELRGQIKKEWAKISPHLTATQIVQIARHPQRPYTLDYIGSLVEDFTEMHGDRRFADDPAIVAGLGFYRGKTTAIIGHQKGRSTRERIARNFGQPNPEGYRKALRVMKTAEKFGFPIVTLIDTPGAYPGIGAEERGQAEAIAYNLKEISTLRVPIVIVIIGEGGSGGALAVGVGDTVMMLENSFYSVISPEGCAAILWKDQSAVPQAAKNMKIRAQDLLELGIIDKIIPEPPGGAHIDPEETFKTVDKHIHQALKKLEAKSVEDLLEERYQKFRKMGVFKEK
jgi:acetyl-CoA carboxylase carboxyl transferase subunit alpha